MESLGECERDFDGAKGIVALPEIEEAWNASDRVESDVVEAVFAASQSEDEGVGGELARKFCVVIATSSLPVAAADDEEMANSARFDGFDDFVGDADNGVMCKSGDGFCATIDPWRRVFGVVTAEF